MAFSVDYSVRKAIELCKSGRYLGFHVEIKENVFTLVEGSDIQLNASTGSWEDFIKALPSDSCRFVVFVVNGLLRNGQTAQRFCFFHWCAKNAGGEEAQEYRSATRDFEAFLFEAGLGAGEFPRPRKDATRPWVLDQILDVDFASFYGRPVFKRLCGEYEFLYPNCNI